MIEHPEFEYLKSINQPVLALDDLHPAKKFLHAFIECRWNCVGRELGQFEAPIDQEWKSASDGRVWTFSAFAYGVLSFDIELDGYLTSAPFPTESERWDLQNLPLHRSLMHECAQAARQSGNKDIIELTDEVLEMLSLWEGYLEFRRNTISRVPPGL